MSIEGQGNFFAIYFPDFVCFVLYIRYQVSVYRTIGPLVILGISHFGFEGRTLVLIVPVKRD